MKGSDYGMKYVQKAMSLSKKNSKVLDIGCGSTGRTIDEALNNGFEITGIDVSSEMIRIARDRHPTVDFVIDDFGNWSSPDCFDLIIAWDSLMRFVTI